MSVGCSSVGVRSVGLPPASVVVNVQLLSPTSDITAGGWTPSSGTDLFAMLDEPVPVDSDYIVTITPTYCEIKLSAPSGTPGTGSHVLRYRFLAGTGSIEVSLKQGTTIIATWGPHTLTASTQDFAQTLTAPQAAAITDYTDLRVGFTSS